MATFLIDIDNTICITKETDYLHSKPIKKMIDKVNKLFDAGNTIKIFTGRGSTSGKDWKSITEDQLRIWKVKYHELRFGKPSADYIVDDKVMSIDKFLRY